MPAVPLAETPMEIDDINKEVDADMMSQQSDEEMELSQEEGVATVIKEASGDGGVDTMPVGMAQVQEDTVVTVSGGARVETDTVEIGGDGDSQGLDVDLKKEEKGAADIEEAGGGSGPTEGVRGEGESPVEVEEGDKLTEEAEGEGGPTEEADRATEEAEGEGGPMEEAEGGDRATEEAEGEGRPTERKGESTHGGTATDIERSKTGGEPTEVKEVTREAPQLEKTLTDSETAEEVCGDHSGREGEGVTEQHAGTEGEDLHRGIIQQSDLPDTDTGQTEEQDLSTTEQTEEQSEPGNGIFSAILQSLGCSKDDGQEEEEEKEEIPDFPKTLEGFKYKFNEGLCLGVMAVG
jgi:hypothetical protein